MTVPHPGGSNRLSVPRQDRPAWWSPNEHLDGLSGEAQRLAWLVEPSLWSAEPLVDELPALAEEAVPDAVQGLRDAILAAERAGCPPERSEELHRRLDARAAELWRVMGERLVTAHRRLLEGVSHDLRSPLNSVLFLADALLNEHSGPLNANQKRQLGVLYGATMSLVKLVNDLIDYARLSEEISIAPAEAAFSVAGVLQEVERLVAPLVDQKQVRLVVHDEVRGERSGNPSLMARVLINLVSNAIDAVEARGGVEVVVRSPDPGTLLIEVTNDGPPEDLEALRERVAGRARPERVRSRAGWTRGLGLSICARLVRAARGRIEVETADGRTRFVVELPFRSLSAR